MKGQLSARQAGVVSQAHVLIKPKKKIGLPFTGAEIKAIDLQGLADKLAEIKDLNPANFSALGHGPLLVECRRLLQKGVNYLRAEVIHAEEINGKKLYRFNLHDEANFPATITSLCQDIFCELSEAGIRGSVAA